MNKTLSYLYKKMLPFGVKNILKYGYSLIPLRIRLGNEFFDQLSFLEKSQWWSEGELQNYQNEQLRKLVRHAYTNVAYYRSLFTSLKLTPDDIKTTGDLYKIPVLTKDDVRNNLPALKAANFKDSEIVKFSTSGTTGKPTIFYFDKKKDYLNFDPITWRFFGWVEHTIDERHTTLSSWTTSNRTHIYNPVRNLLILSAYNLNMNNAEQYAAVIKKYRVRYLDGYPSSIELLTSFLKEKNIPRPVQLKAVFSHSEHLYDWQRKNIETFWGCRCFDWYTMEESVVFGVECEKHEGLHLCSDFGITEFLDSGLDEYKRIIATGFNNYATPLIRYETGDTGIPLQKKCSCGRGFPLFKMHGGRKKNFAIGKDGSYISVTNIDIPHVSDNVRQFQFVQDAQGAMRLNIIKKNSFKDKDLYNIQGTLHEKFGKNMDVVIAFTDTLEQTKNKKTPIFIQYMRK